VGKTVGRPRAQVTRDQVLALRAQGLSYRAAARRLHISPAQLIGWSVPYATPEAFESDCASATGKRSKT
jgi:hypothetical protein